MSHEEQPTPNPNDHNDDGNTSENPQEDNSKLSSQSSVKLRSNRAPSEKGLQFKITQLKSSISRGINTKLRDYEAKFSNIDTTDYDAYIEYAELIANDGISAEYDELKALCQNKIDEQIERLCDYFNAEKESYLKLAHERLDEMEQAAEQEALEIEEQLRRQLQELEERRQNTASRRHQQKSGNRSNDKSDRERPSSALANQATNGHIPSTSLMENDEVISRHGDSVAPIQNHVEQVMKNSPQQYGEEDNSSIRTTSGKSTELSAMEVLANSITQSIKSSKRTIVEPTIFYGDPMKYKDWEVDFDDFLDAEAITTSARKMRMLKKFVDGEARQCIEGFLLDDSTTSYNEARNTLKERFGKKITISRHLKKRLREWPKINCKDGHALQRFADFLTHLYNAKQTISHLSSLDEPETNEEMLEKLPDWLITKWKYQVRKFDKAHQDYPPFEVFKEFICEEAAATNIFSTRDNAKCDKETINQKKSYHPRKLQTFQTSATPARTTRFCKRCNKDSHHTAQCEILVKATYEEALQFFKQHNLCFHCGKDNHRHNQCNKKWICKLCKREHPECLHKTRRDWEIQKAAQSMPTTNSSSQQQKKETPTGQTKEADANLSQLPPKPHVAAMANRHGQPELLNMLLPVTVRSENGDQVTIYAMLDNGSDTTYITEQIAKSLKLKPYCKPEQVTVRTLAGEETGYRNRYKFSVRGISPAADDVDFSVIALEQKSIPYSNQHIPSEQVTRRFSHLQHIAHLISPKLDLSVEMLIGRDHSHLLAPYESIVGDPKEPFAVRTALGWTLCGGNSEIHAPQLACLASHTDEFTDINDERKMSQNDMVFVKVLEEGMKEMEDGTLSLPLPFAKTPQLPNNKAQAQKRFSQLLQKFKKDPKLKEEYFSFMEEIIESGHAEKVSEKEVPSGKTWYLPHFAVYHPKKKSLRVVFDASVKYEDKCLNEELLAGPDHMNSLAGILLRFRREPVAISCDIQKMFHNFQVNEEDRDYLRFLWTDSKLKTVMEYRMTVHLFGATSSPGVATFALRKLASNALEEMPKAAEFITNNFYVDDGITSTATEEEAIALIRDATKLCGRANLRLHKFLSNSRNVLNSLPQSEIAKNLQGLNIYKDKLPSERTLGLEWCTEKDSFTFSNNLVEKPPTKRGILSSVSQIYDPLGLLAPFLLQGRILMQQSCQQEGGWDDPVPRELQTRWISWIQDMDNLKLVCISRCLKPKGFSEISRAEIHYFGDASLMGYGACAYLRIINNHNQVHVTLITAKSRVIPSKGMTIPRLELQAAVEAVKLAVFIRAELKMPIDQEYFWSDSTATLGFIKNSTTQFYMFTANRVNQIRQHSEPEQWHHIAGSENPADIASRGASAAQLANSEWYNGPSFLQQLDISNRLQNTIDFQEALKGSPEIKHSRTTLTSEQNPGEEAFISIITKKFSSWKRLVRAIANAKLLLRNKSFKKVTEITPSHLEEAEAKAISLTQSVSFPQEISQLKREEEISKTSTIRRLTPFLDNQGMLRLNSRSTSNLTYGEKYPLIIPKSELSKLLIDHFHRKTHHAGTNVTISALRQAGYWVIGASATARSIIFNCINCRRIRSKPVEQIMGQLPEERTEPSPPFTHIGMDVFGHFIVKDRRSEIKRWGIVFTCTYSRGIHIELLDDLTTDSFLQALRRFQAIRGQVKTILCDNGTNFIGGRNQLIKDLVSMDDSQLKAYLLDNKIEFKTNTPSASHQGGLWERQIRTIRSILNAMSTRYSGRLTTESLRTAFMEITGAINNRPISVTSMKETEPIITVNHLLTGKSWPILPAPGEFTSEEIYGRQMYRKSQQVAKEFWEMWSSQYLTKIETRQQWQTKKTNLKVGDIVSIIDSNQPRNLWQVGRVIAVHLGKDQNVRKVSIVLATTSLDSSGKITKERQVIERPAQKLILLMST